MNDRLTADETAELAVELSQLVASGFPLEAGLTAASRELAPGRVSRALGELAQRLRAGVPLDLALTAMGPRLPRHLRSLMLAGIRAGDLATALEQFVDCQASSRQLRWQVATTLFYPGVLFSLLAVIFVLFRFTALGALEDIEMPSFGTAEGSGLPDSTKLILWLGERVPGFLGAAAVVSGLVFIAVRITFGQMAIERLWMSVPLLGPIWRWRALAEFSRLMSLLLDRRLPLPVALRLAGDGAGRASLRDAGQLMAKDVDAGQPLAEAVMKCWLFPPTLIPLLAWGERMPALEEGWRAVAELCENRAQVHLDLLRTVVPPVTFLTVLILMSLMAHAYFMPLITAVRSLGS